MESETATISRLVATISTVSHEIVDDNYFVNTSDTCTRILRYITSDKNGCELDSNFPASIDRILLNSLRCSSVCDSQTVKQCVTNCFRVCRNLCAINAANQNVLHCHDGLINTVHLVISQALETGLKEEDDRVLMRCAVQFLGNYASGNRENQLEVWQKFQTVFLKLLEIEDQKLQDYVLIVVHICLGDLAASLDSPPVEDPCWHLVKAVINYAVKHDSANGLLVVEDVLRLGGFCEHVYRNIDCPSQLLVLEVLINTLKRLPEEVEGMEEVREDCPALQNLQFIAADFILQAHMIPEFTRSTSSTFEREALCTVKELEVVCLATSHHKRYGALQNNPKLVSATVGLLQAVQELGRQGNNVFTNVEKMSQQREVNPDHPVFGLKRDLIRLLGNLAYKHRENQDMVRELEGLPLIMEQTNIDGKNPFITQWSVFALHNLTENNEDNRLYIANLKLEGIANNQSVLEEMGLTAETEGEKVVIKKKRTDR